MENTKKILTVNEILGLNDALEILFQEHIKYPINIGFKLYQLKKHLNDITEYTVNRIVELLPDLKKDDCELSDNDKLVYQVILNSEIEIDTYGITREELYCIYKNNNKNNPIIDLGIIEKLEPLF